MKTKKIYWKNIDQLDSNNQEIKKIYENEFVSKLPVNQDENKDQLDNNHTRRDFLKYLGYSTAAATIAACEGPVIKSVPYVVQPEQIIPGIANYYATTIADGYDFASVLIKTREGRPIKVQNNKETPYLGSANARVNASVLSMYDSLRIQGPKFMGKDISWKKLYNQTTKTLKSLSKAEEKVVLLTNSLASPSTEKIISEFLNLYPNISHVVYDPISSDSALNAFEQEYGIRALPDYDFSKANNIISFDADILGDWQGGGYESGYSKGRVPNKKNSGEKHFMSWHIQLESNMSLSGANADKRVALKPSEIKNILFKLYSNLANKKTSISLSSEHQMLLDQILNKKSLLKRLDYSKKLVGQVKQEFQLPRPFVKKNLEKVILNEVKKYIFQTIGKKVKKISIKNFWIVRQFNNEYNPIHYHDGHISGVGYLKIPKFVSKSNKKSKIDGTIDFINGNKMFLSESIYNHQPKEGDVILFPHYLMHTAYPFKSNGERRSFSFNLEIDKKIANVFSK